MRDEQPNDSKHDNISITCLFRSRLCFLFSTRERNRIALGGEWGGVWGDAVKDFIVTHLKDKKMREEHLNDSKHDNISITCLFRSRLCFLFNTRERNKQVTNPYP